ncbi:hypothetical protein EVAR_20634_1 [Eumeta japonica]|uniref:Uncharacterized protein n=1 Tax=Eumeta variegata TaxID=151549 RepID=A0A4C1VB94_EUMVA|nr:hypothetical protein EVAR_20634_1 [Eumeta japonica]
MGNYKILYFLIALSRGKLAIRVWSPPPMGTHDFGGVIASMFLVKCRRRLAALRRIRCGYEYLMSNRILSITEAARCGQQLRLFHEGTRGTGAVPRSDESPQIPSLSFNWRVQLHSILVHVLFGFLKGFQSSVCPRAPALTETAAGPSLLF